MLWKYLLEFQKNADSVFNLDSSKYVCVIEIVK